MLYYRLRLGKVTYAGNCVAAWRYWMQRERELGRTAEVLVLKEVVRFCEQGQQRIATRTGKILADLDKVLLTAFDGGA